MHRLILVLVALAAVPLLADDTDRSPSAGAAPYTVALAMDGYSPVSYLDEKRAEPGSPRFAAEYKGRTYFLTSEGQRRAFLRSPERYMPAYGGYCAYGCAVNGKFTVDPTNFKIVDGRTHLFLRNDDVDTLELWNRGDERELKTQADRFWRTQAKSRAYTGARNVPASGVAIDGYSPVSYFTEGRARKGDPRFRAEHDGVIYQFASEKERKLFNENPEKYVPQCGGWCAFGMSIQDKFPVDPTAFAVLDGKLYLFLDNAEVNALELWKKGDEKELRRKAHAHWRKVSGGA